MYVQQGLPISSSHGKTSQREVKLSGITMGGTGHGSKLNTRIAYIPVAKRNEGDAPLSDPNFPYFDGYLVEFVDNKIANGEAIAMTKIHHDSCVAYDGCVVLVHEARSGSDEEELTKLLMGLCRMLLYSTDPYGWYTTSGWAHFVKAEINVATGVIEYRKCSIVHNTTDSTNMDRKVTNIITLIKHLAGILAIKETSIDAYKRSTRGTRDNPQKKIKSGVLSLGEQEGLFCLEKAAIPALTADSFGEQVLRKGWNDIEAKAQPHSVKGSR